jgi:predicted GIY-YIG superfamily endonuclease
VETEYQVYVIQNPEGGVSEDVRHRVSQHNEGISNWTKGKGPWSLVWTSEAKSLSDARKLENLLKKQKARLRHCFHDQRNRGARDGETG